MKLLGIVIFTLDLSVEIGAGVICRLGANAACQPGYISNDYTLGIWNVNRVYQSCAIILRACYYLILYLGTCIMQLSSGHSYRIRLGAVVVEASVLVT
jgi:hypothetical protein